MKNKGFTLVELLAVIVILAVIALIATPVILSMIESSRKGAAESSMLSYVDATEKTIVTHSMNAASSVDYDHTYSVMGTTLTEMKEMPGDKVCVKIENNTKIYSKKEKGSCPSGYEENKNIVAFNIDVKGDQVRPEIVNTIIVTENVVTEAHMKFGKYYVSYFYDKKTGNTKYCSNTQGFAMDKDTCGDIREAVPTQPNSIPTIEDVELTGTSVTFKLKDTEGLSGYAVTTSRSKPTKWNNISGKEYEGSYEATTLDTYYIHVKNKESQTAIESFAIDSTVYNNWKIMLILAKLNPKDYATVNDFLGDTTALETVITKNESFDYLKNSIDMKKSFVNESNYVETSVPFLLSTDKRTVAEKYSAGLPIYLISYLSWSGSQPTGKYYGLTGDFLASGSISGETITMSESSSSSYGARQYVANSINLEKYSKASIEFSGSLSSCGGSSTQYLQQIVVLFVNNSIYASYSPCGSGTTHQTVTVPAQNTTFEVHAYWGGQPNYTGTLTAKNLYIY